MSPIQISRFSVQRLAVIAETLDEVFRLGRMTRPSPISEWEAIKAKWHNGFETSQVASQPKRGPPR